MVHQVLSSVNAQMPIEPSLFRLFSQLQLLREVGDLLFLANSEKCLALELKGYSLPFLD